MPLTLERIEKEASPHLKPFLILMYHIAHKNLQDIIPEISEPYKDMTDAQKESYNEMLTELILQDTPKKEILRQIPTLVQEVKAKE